jgi:hypothetical protein
MTRHKNRWKYHLDRTGEDRWPTMQGKEQEDDKGDAVKRILRPVQVLNCLIREDKTEAEEDE